MPVLKRRFSHTFPKGTQTATGRCESRIHLHTAVQVALNAYDEEFGGTPVLDERVMITIAFTTFETIAEVLVRPEEEYTWP